ncbi:MAG TPA: undecaprenyl-diphosphate phosphatase [Acidimicrobiales bacterium]|nr:undecaprenyl-diphosphate phosphatase [Acidimicrobiales bacterium]
MPLLHAVVLGVVQGLTEFLPVSSSGHLIVVPWLFGWHELDHNAALEQAFDVALHMGTFAGVVVYFRDDLIRLATRERRLGSLLVLSAVPGALTGAGLDAVLGDKAGPEWLIGVLLVVFGLVLLWADRLPGEREQGDFGVREALLMGAAQAAALQPGVSRSGATISMGRRLRFDRDSATRLSFLMSIPIMAGAGLYEGVKLVRDGGIPAGFGNAFGVGTLVSAITGFLAIWGLLRFVRSHSFRPFVAYRVVAGVGIVLVAASSLR